MTSSSMESPLDDVRIGEQTSIWAKNNHLAVQYLETCESTSDLAKKEAMSAAVQKMPLKIYLTDLQTRGRGRGTNTWSNTKPGPQLLMTVSFQMAEPPQPTLSPRLGLALWTAARASWPFLDWSLKAPNDLFLGKNKVAGILLENVIQGEQVRTLLGLGMNVFASPEDIATSTSLLENLPVGVPLLAEDWFRFCDRLFLEISQALGLSFEDLGTNDQQSLLYALNQFPALKNQYTKADQRGNLWLGSKKISWSEL